MSDTIRVLSDQRQPGLYRIVAETIVYSGDCQQAVRFDQFHNSTSRPNPTLRALWGEGQTMVELWDRPLDDEDAQMIGLQGVAW